MLVRTSEYLWAMCLWQNRILNSGLGLVLLMLIASGTVRSQSLCDSVNQIAVPIEQFSLNAGLSQGMINAMAEDQDG